MKLADIQGIEVYSESGPPVWGNSLVWFWQRGRVVNVKLEVILEGRRVGEALKKAGFAIDDPTKFDEELRKSFGR